MHLSLYDVSDITLTKDIHNKTETHVLSVTATSEGNRAVVNLFFHKENKAAWDVIAQHLPNPPEWDEEQVDD
jgi:hypothetical protein